VVDRIVIVNNSRFSNGVIRSKILTQVGVPLDREVLKQDLARIFGSNEFERVSFDFPLLPNGEHELRILVDEKSWGPKYLRFGLNLEDNLQGNSDYNLGVNYSVRAINSLGGEWRNELQIGDVVGLSTEFYQPLDERGQFFVVPTARATNSTLLVREGNRLMAELDIAFLQAGLDVGVNFSNWGSLRTALIGYNQFAGARDVAFGFPTYLGASIEFANATNVRSRLLSDGQFGASLFLAIDLPLAPLYFGYGIAESGERSLYLFLGQTF
jgi:NTE family protein